MTPEHERLVERLECAGDRTNVIAPRKDLQDAQAAILALSEENERLREALRRADQFITNGVELGFIRMPDAGTPDPAHETPGIIRAALVRDAVSHQHNEAAVLTREIATLRTSLAAAEARAEKAEKDSESAFTRGLREGNKQAIEQQIAIGAAEARAEKAESRAAELKRLVEKHACDCDEGMCGAIGGRDSHKCGFEARSTLSRIAKEKPHG